MSQTLPELHLAKCKMKIALPQKALLVSRPSEIVKWLCVLACRTGGLAGPARYTSARAKGEHEHEHERGA